MNEWIIKLKTSYIRDRVDAETTQFAAMKAKLQIGIPVTQIHNF